MAEARNKDWIKIALVVLAGYLLFNYMSKETMDNTQVGQIYEGYQQKDDENVAYEEAKMIEAMEVPDKAISNSQKLSAEDLLPKYDDANEFVKENPVSKLLKEQNFLISGHHVGINTVMQSNKIPYHDLRAAPPIPKESVSPFLNSSYEQPMGSNIKPLLT